MAKGRKSRKSKKQQREEALSARQEKKFYMILIGVTLCVLVLLYVVFMMNS